MPCSSCMYLLTLVWFIYCEGRDQRLSISEFRKNEINGCWISIWPICDGVYVLVGNLGRWFIAENIDAWRCQACYLGIESHFLYWFLYMLFLKLYTLWWYIAWYVKNVWWKWKKALTVCGLVIFRHAEMIYACYTLSCLKKTWITFRTISDLWLLKSVSWA